MQKIHLVIGNAGDGSNFIEIVQTQEAIDKLENLADSGDERYASGDGLQIRPLIFSDEFALDAWVARNFGGYSDQDILADE